MLALLRQTGRLRGLPSRATGRQPGPQRRPALRELPGHRRRSDQRTHRARHPPRSHARRGRDRRGPRTGHGPTRRATSPGLGRRRPPRSADRHRLRRPRPRRPAVHRRTREGRSGQGRPARVPALPRREGTVQGAGRQEDLSELLRPSCGRPLFRLRVRTRARHSRRSGPAGVSELHDQTARQPGGVRRLRSPQTCREPAARRAPVPELPPEDHRGVRHLRANGALRHVPGHRPTLVRPLPAAMDGLQQLRHRRPGPQRHLGSALVREVHQPRPGLLGPLPGLHHHLATEHPSLPTVRPRPTGTRSPRRRHRGDPPRTRLIPRGVDGCRAPGRRHGLDLPLGAPQSPGAHRTRRAIRHPRSARRTARRQGVGPPAQRPGRDRRPAAS